MTIFATVLVAARAHKQAATATFDTQKILKTGKNDAAKPLRKELDKIDGQMQVLNLEKDQLQTQLANTRASADLAQTGKRIKAIDSEIGTLEERWLELTEQIETAAV